MKTIRAVTEIAAPVETVWAELAAVSGTPGGTRSSPSFEGELVVGGSARGPHRAARRAPDDLPPDDHRGGGGDALEWLGRLLVPGVFDGRHSFHLEAAIEPAGPG